MIITRTPFRLSFFGGGTDYPAWYSKHGGLVIGTSFKRYCYLTCRWLPPFFAHKTQVIYSRVEQVKNNLDIQHPAVRACLQYLGIDQGMEIHHDGDLPARSGIGSSSSFTVGLLLALHGLKHQMLTKRQLADEAIKIEQEILKENVGIQDQILAAHGGLTVIEMGPGPDYRVFPLVLPPDYRAALHSHFLIGFTGVTRISSTVASDHVKAMEAGTSRVDEIFGVAKEALSLFNKRASINEIGALVHKSWEIKRSLGKRVSNDAVDAMYDTARKAGAYGGKLLGAGGGGFIMFFAPPERHQAIKDALPQVKIWVPFEFDHEGSQIVFYNDAYPES